MTRLLKYFEVAARLGMTEGSLREGLATHRLQIPTVRVGVRGRRIAESDLEAYVADNRCLPGERDFDAGGSTDSASTRRSSSARRFITRS
jgi:hypothetical protein